MIDLNELRRIEFPWTSSGELSYLNHAGTGPLPTRTRTALATWDEMRSEPWRVSWTDERATLSAHASCARE